jgi:hypothetical protein
MQFARLPIHLAKQPSHLPMAHELVQHAVRSEMVAHAASDYRWVDAELSRK